EEPSAEVIEEPLAEVIEEPLAEVIEEPSAELDEELEILEFEEAPSEEEEPSAEVIEEPSAEVIEEPSAETMEEPSAETMEEPSAEVVEEPSTEVIEEPALEELEELELEELELEELELEAEESAVPEAAELEDLSLDEIELTEDFVEEESEESSLGLEEIELEEEIETLEEIELEPAIDTAEVAITEMEDTLEDFDLEEVAPAAELDIAPVADFDEAPAADFDIAPAAEFNKEPVEESEVETETTADALLEDDELDLEEIFAIEAEEKLQIVDEFVAGPGTVTGDLVAAFHTLKGSSAMAEISSIMTIAAPLEQMANDYLLQNRDADERLIGLARDAAALMRLVLADIESNREEVAGSQALLDRLFGEETSEEEVTFEFEKIILLSQANIASDGWQDVGALVQELQHTDEQAQVLNQPELSALVHSMLRVYSESPGRPDDLTLSLMKRAHDHLVFIFDSLASSQPVRPADNVIAELDALDLSAAEESDSQAVGETTETKPQLESIGPAETDLPEDDADEDILPIFLEETEELLEEIDESILGWAESGEPGEHLDNLLRQLHTLKGGARMAGLASLGEFAHNFETFLIGMQSKPVDWDDNFFALLNAQQDEITRRAEIYQNLANGNVSDAELNSMRSAAIPSLDAPVVAAPDVTVAPKVEAVALTSVEAVVELPEDKVDEDILPIFLEESDDLVEELESSIQSWSESPGNKEILDVLLRNLHTLKGGARMAGLNSLGEYAHNFETFLIGIQQNPIELDDDFFALLNQRQDEVIRRVEIYKKLSVGAATEEDLTSMKQALEPGLEAAEPSTVPASTDQGTTEEETAKKGPADKGAPSANQEMIRVSADLVEELIGLAGESSINRGRVEQQITDFGESLQDMEQTINRIRDQVRQLEIEAESRETLIRTNSENQDSSFDELEMDRYTMLQAVSRVLNEATSDMTDLKDTLVNRSRDAETLLHQQARISSELQEGLTRTRMVPFARLIPRLRRIVRQISAEVGKSVRFDAYNVEGELDRNVLERIVAPLEHMLRNAVDHGIEDTERRVATGKPEQGRISLRLSREGGYVVLTISDDGGGINVEAVRKKAVERGLMTEAQELSDHDVMQFILHAGFSTAQKLTQISGRGVGMDVVVSEIKSLGGNITIDSSLGVGSEFTIRIPFTVSINRALMVVVREETYAIPLNTIEGIVRVSPYELEAYYQPDAPMFEYAGQPYRLAYMGRLLDRGENPNFEGQVAPLPVILARAGDDSVALQVDRVIGSREVVVKTLGAQFDDVGGISGATVLGDGSVVIILDCMALVRTYEAAVGAAEREVEESVLVEPESRVRKVMIVDDSVTVRKVTSRLMERQGYEVITAKDGVDAMEQLQEARPDVILLDIEMPRMDGFEVLRSVRRDDAIKDLPIIMITSRTGEKHKQQAMELGVNEYLGKPFQEASLLATIENVIESAKAKSQQD
ncbi:MAG: response regulator, partial [Gammaproteobacteria bacterium]|nr:response regulator [Gammaproteobacteria bacterium]